MLLRLQALDPRLGLLLLEDDEGPPVLVEDHGHGGDAPAVRTLGLLDVLLLRRSN